MAAAAPVCTPPGAMLSPHHSGLSLHNSGLSLGLPGCATTSGTFAALADHFLSQSAAQAPLQIAPLQLQPAAPRAAPAAAPLPKPAQPRPQAPLQPSLPDLDGPSPGLSAFAQEAAAAALPAPTPTPAADPERFRGLPELPELPSSMFTTSGNLKPLISAFAAAAGEAAFAATSAAAAEAEHAQSAPAALTARNLEQRLPSIPQRHTCPCNTQVSLNPIIWRNFEPPYRIMVHVGLKTAIEEGEVSLPLGIYSTLNPRVITTGTCCLQLHSSACAT